MISLRAAPMAAITSSGSLRTCTPCSDDQRLQRLGVLGHVFGPDRVVEALAGLRDYFLQVVGQFGIGLGIDAAFLGRGGLAHAGPVVVGRDLVIAEGRVRPRPDELARIEGAGLQRLEHCGARHGLCRHAELGAHLRRDARGAELQALEVLDRIDLVPEPAGPLRTGVAAQRNGLMPNRAYISS
jgi:hypothetical protein